MAGIILAGQPFRQRSVPRESETSLLLAVLNAKCRSLSDDFSTAANTVTPANLVNRPRGAVFNGSSSTLTVTDTADLRQTGDWTIAYWFRIESNRDFDRHFNKHSADGVHVFSRASGKTQFTVNGDDGDVTSQDLIASTDTGRWYRVVIVNDADVGVKGYVDGTLAYDGTTPVGDASESANLVIGTYAGTFMDGDIWDFRYYSDAKNATWVATDFARGVPDDTLVLAVDGTGVDRSRYGLSLTYSGGVKIGGKWIVLDGTDDKIDAGDIGNIQEIAAWVRPASTTQELFLLDTGKDIMIDSGTVTYTGLTPTATYVEGSAGTTMVANKWQHLVCQFETTDANNMELGNDGTNYGQFDCGMWLARTTARGAAAVAVENAQQRGRF